jgi:thiamine biosynthesis lipoprotein
VGGDTLAVELQPRRVAERAIAHDESRELTMVDDATFDAMGSTAHVVVVGGDERHCDLARSRMADLEARWSRFRDTSEVSRLNRAAGRPCAVSWETRLLVRRAVQGNAATAGRFDPTLLGAMLRLGYDRSFELIGSKPMRRYARVRVDAGHIEVDDRAGTVRLPPGVGFDPGGIGKGLAADLVVRELLAEGAEGACVNVGGDVRVRGPAPDGGEWRIGIEDPRGGPPLAVVGLSDGAVATSSRARRRWLGDGGELHHLVDPLTGTSACTPVLAASVVAAEGWRAEVLAKAAFLDGLVGRAGTALGLARLERLGVAALIVDERGVATTATWSAFALEMGGPRLDLAS